MSEYSNNALAIYKQLYFADGEKTPEAVHKRVADRIGDDDNQRENFRNLMDSKSFRPNTPALINAGRTNTKHHKHNEQYCACFVLGLNDSMNSIIELWKTAAQIYASGAGAGMPITNLREKSADISTGGKASGPATYMEVIESISQSVRSGGKSRRAANKADLWFDHPDVNELIGLKEQGKLNAFNISVMTTDKFMTSVLKAQDHGKKLFEDMKSFVCDYRSPSNFTKGTFDGTDLWKKIIQGAWKNGDPGLQFFDTINKFNAFPSLGAIEATNACGEVPLPPWAVCNLGSINLINYLNKDKTDINWNKFADDIFIAIQFLDNVIDKTSFLNEKFEQVTKTIRPLGLGLMGFADLLYELKIPYGSDASLEMFEKICWFLNKEAIRSSIKLVSELKKQPLDVPLADSEHFRNLLKYYTSSWYMTDQLQIVEGEFFDASGDDEILDLYDKYGIRNSTWTSIAPTGSIALSVDASYAWEPVFALAWDKKLIDTGKILHITNPYFDKVLPEIVKATGVNKEKILTDIITNSGSIQKIPYIPKEFRDLFIVAHDVDPISKLKMQSKGQKWISQAISNTTNLPNSATEKEINDIYLKAWQWGLKGITIFRDGCRDDQVVHFGKLKEDKQVLKDIVPSSIPDPEKTFMGENYQRPITLYGPTVCVPTPAGKLYITINFDRGHFIELFIRLGKSGGDTTILLDSLSRLISKSLQKNSMSFNSIMDSIEGMVSDHNFFFKPDDQLDKSVLAHSITDAVAKVLKHHCITFKPPTVMVTKNEVSEQKKEGMYTKCPYCGQMGFRVDLGSCHGGTCIICGGSSCQ